MRLALSYVFYDVSIVVYECVPESEFYSFPSIKCTLVRGGLFFFSKILLGYGYSDGVE